MKYLLLLFRMLRYRVAIMLLLFFLLGMTAHHTIFQLTYLSVFAMIALLASYITATTVNDIADKKIDAINHPHNKGRPLITGDATVKDLLIVHSIGVALTIIPILFVGIKGVIVIGISLVINYIYSTPPLKLSYRTFLAPIILAIAYVVIPYMLGLIVIGEKVTHFDLLFLTSLFALFCGRILLKDFRDRKGDAAYGKPTMVLKYGKTATCITSVSCIFIGNILLFSILHVSILILIFLQLIFCTIYVAEYKLWQVHLAKEEQVMIGLGAKMGNGLLLTLLGLFIIQSYPRSETYVLVFVIMMVILYIGNFIAIITHPDKVVLGYKG